jgi:SAM-dependent methyltransferase
MIELSHSDIYSGNHGDIYDGFSAVVRHAEHLYSYLIGRDFFRGASNCLSIGPGKGALELMLMENYPDLKMSLVEPSEVFLRYFRAEAERKRLMQRVESILAGKFQTAKFGCKFDRILSIHSWYGIGNDRETLEKALELLKPGGKIFITAADRANVSWLERCGISKYQWNSDSFSQWLRDIGVEHTHDTELRLIPRASIFAEGNFTESGKGHLAFEVLLPFDEIPNEKQSAFERAIPEDGLELSFGCITISKPE